MLYRIHAGSGQSWYRTKNEWSIMEARGCTAEGAEPYALRVMGDSMAPEFADGQIVIVDPSVAVASGLFVVVDFGGEVILGQYSAEPEWIKLSFLNADYAPVTLVPPYEIKGVVVQRAGRRRREHKHYAV